MIRATRIILNKFFVNILPSGRLDGEETVPNGVKPHWTRRLEAGQKPTHWMSADIGFELGGVSYVGSITLANDIDLNQGIPVAPWMATNDAGSPTLTRRNPDESDPRGFEYRIHVRPWLFSLTGVAFQPAVKPNNPSDPERLATRVFFRSLEWEDTPVRDSGLGEVVKVNILDTATEPASEDPGADLDAGF